MAARNLTCAWLLLLPGCASPPRPPEADLPASLALPTGAPVQVLVTATPGAPLPRAPLAEALACALEQSTTLDFQVEPVTSEGAPSPSRTKSPAAEAEFFLEPLPGSPDRWRFRIEVRRLTDGAATRLVATPTLTDTKSLLAGLDALGRALRRTLGEPLPAVLGQSQPLALACTLDPDTLTALGQARTAVREGRILEAGEALERALRKDPACARARIFLASLLLEGGAQDAAQRLLEVAGLGAVHLNAVDQHRLERLRLRARGSHDELRLLGERFQDSHPGHPEGAFSLGLALNHLGKFHHAEPIWRRLTDRDLLSASACFQLGLSLFGLGRFEEAASVWEGLDARSAQPIQAAFFPALARLSAGQEDAARAHLESFLPRARDRASLRARLRLLLCAQAILAKDPERAETEASEVLRECRADPLPTRQAWSLAGSFLLYRRQAAPVERFLSALPLDAESCPNEIRLAALWLQGLQLAENPRDGAADRASAQLRECRWLQEACQIDAALAAGRGNGSARIFNLREAALANPSPWNRLQLAAGLLEEGGRSEALELLKELAEPGLTLDLDQLDLHPAANPLSAVALVEARRRLAEAGQP